MKFTPIGFLFISAFIISGCSATGSIKGVQAQPEVEEIEWMEREVQELKSRILKLEAKLTGIKTKGEPDISGDGWKTLSSWRKLKAGMYYESVKKILGSAHRIDGGIFAIWYYKNGGRVNFYDGGVTRWKEPD